MSEEQGRERRVTKAAFGITHEQIVADSLYVERSHEELWAVCKKLPSDFDPWGQRSRDDCEKGEEWRDCSCSCAWFHVLIGDARCDWGVCVNPKSPRAGLLTFEHQGCPQYEPGPNVNDQIVAING